MYYNSRLDEKGATQSENWGCLLELSRLGEKGVAQSENLGCLLELSRPGDPISPERRIRVLSGVVSLGRQDLAWARIHLNKVPCQPRSSKNFSPGRKFRKRVFKQRNPKRGGRSLRVSWFSAPPLLNPSSIFNFFYLFMLNSWGKWFLVSIFSFYRLILFFFFYASFGWLKP